MSGDIKLGLTCVVVNTYSDCVILLLDGVLD